MSSASHINQSFAPDSALFNDWLAALRAGRPVRAFTDLMFAPVPIALVVDAVAALLRSRARGIFQLSGPRDISYSAAAHFLAEKRGADRKLIQDISARDGGQPPGAAVPYTSLDSTLLRERYGITVPDAWEVLQGIL